MYRRHLMAVVARHIRDLTVRSDQHLLRSRGTECLLVEESHGSFQIRAITAILAIFDHNDVDNCREQLALYSRSRRAGIRRNAPVVLWYRVKRTSSRTVYLPLESSAFTPLFFTNYESAFLGFNPFLKPVKRDKGDRAENDWPAQENRNGSFVCKVPAKHLPKCSLTCQGKPYDHYLRAPQPLASRIACRRSSRKQPRRHGDLQSALNGKE
jgi:hypothetical protein